jgi:hypothetical protein
MANVLGKWSGAGSDVTGGRVYINGMLDCDDDIHTRLTMTSTQD